MGGYLQAACPRHQLLQQLRPVSISREAVPVVILEALRGEPIPVYGKGENIRDWLYVGDHAEALYTVIAKGRVGQTYNIGGNNERQNIDLVHLLCALLDELRPRADALSYVNQITFVKDRPGHDLRYAVDASKIRRELGWTPMHDHASGFRNTVQWYLDNEAWTSAILNGSYKIKRLGTQI